MNLLALHAGYLLIIFLHLLINKSIKFFGEKCLYLLL